MPAKLFFAMLREGRTIEREKKNSLLVDLTDVCFAANCTTESYKDLRNSYYENSLSREDLQMIEHRKEMHHKMVKEVSKEERKAQSTTLLSIFRSAT